MNGEATHEWRITRLEERMERVETWIYRSGLALVGNLVGVILILAKMVLDK